MTRVLVLYYSSYGHIETMAGAVAEGARQVPGTEVVVKRVPEKGGSPYGATTITGGQGERQPSAVELEAARFQGRHVAEIAKKLHG